MIATVTKEAAAAARKAIGNTGILSRQTLDLLEKLEPRQRKFVMEYLKDFNGTQAAIRAGYSKKTAFVIASENLIKPNIAEAVKSAGRDIIDHSELEVAEADAILASLIRANPTDYMQLTPDGEVVYTFDKNSRNPMAVEECISRIKISGPAEDQVVIKTAGVRLASKKPLLDLYYKRFGLIAPEKHEVTIGDLMEFLNNTQRGGVAAPRIAQHQGKASEPAPAAKKPSTRTRGASVLAAATGART